MKKITFILLALLTGTAFGQSTINSSAEIVAALTFTQNSPLSFGKVDNTAGTVIIGLDGSDDTGSKDQVPGGTTSPGDLTVTGGLGESYVITVEPEATLTGPGVNMPVTSIGHNGVGTLDATTGEETFQIGGTLTVGTDQAVGPYTGTISVTVSYN